MEKKIGNRNKTITKRNSRYFVTVSPVKPLECSTYINETKTRDSPSVIFFVSSQTRDGPNSMAQTQWSLMFMDQNGMYLWYIYIWYSTTFFANHWQFHHARFVCKFRAVHISIYMLAARVRTYVVILFYMYSTDGIKSFQSPRYPRTGGTQSFQPPRSPGSWRDSVHLGSRVPEGLVGLSTVWAPVPGYPRDWRG